MGAPKGSLGPLTHGHARKGRRTTEYSAWRNMLTRCFNVKGEKYPSYGGRGITVCKRWMRFENFIKDLGPKPNGLTLDRINNDGNYEPGNCRWATPSQQALNRRLTQSFREAQSMYKPSSLSKRSGLPKGVCFVKGKYVARVTILGTGIGGERSKIRHLGTFATAHLAAQAVRSAECKKN